MNAPTKLSMRAYARHRKAKGLVGGTPAAVHKAVHGGRISVDEDGLIDPERADAEWASNSTPRVSTSVREPSAPKPAKSERQPQRDSGREATLQMDYLTARSRKESALATQRELELAKIRGELVTVDFLRNQVTRILIALSESLDNLPVTLPPRLEACRTSAERRAAVIAEVERTKAELRGFGATLTRDLDADDPSERDRSVA